MPRRWIARLALAAVPVVAQADDGGDSWWATATWGNGQRVDIYGVGGVWRPGGQAEKFGRSDIEWRVQADVMSWVGHPTATDERVLWDIGLTPMFRWYPGSDTGKGFFAEGGIGAQILTHTKIGVGYEHWRNFSTAYQFGERAAIGTTFGPDDRYEIAVFVQHVSNARIKDPNDGLTYFGVTVRFPLNLP